MSGKLLHKIQNVQNSVNFVGQNAKKKKDLNQLMPNMQANNCWNLICAVKITDDFLFAQSQALSGPTLFTALRKL